MSFPDNILGSSTPRVSANARAEMAGRLQRMLDLRSAGDIDGLMEYMADDVVMFPPTSWRYCRFPYTLRGKPAVREAFLLRRVNYIFLRSTINRLLIDGDEVIAHRTGRTQPRGGGPVTTFDCIDLLRFRDELVVEFNEFCDGAARELVVNFPY